MLVLSGNNRNVSNPSPTKPLQQDSGGGARTSQGDSFADHSFQHATNDTSSSSGAFYYQNMYPNLMADRAGFGSNYSNGAGSDAYARMHNSEQRTFSERCGFCFNRLLRDPVFQTSAALTVSALPIPKGWAKALHSVTGSSRALGASPSSSIYSIAGHILGENKYIPNNIKAMLTTKSSLVLGSRRTSNILRHFGRIAQVAAPVFLTSYSATRMFRCVTEEWD